MCPLNRYRAITCDIASYPKTNLITSYSVTKKIKLLVCFVEKAAIISMFVTLSINYCTLKIMKYIERSRMIKVLGPMLRFIPPEKSFIYKT